MRKVERDLAQAIANKLDGDVIGQAPDGFDLSLSGGWGGLVAFSGERRFSILITAEEIRSAEPSSTPQTGEKK